MKSLLKALVLPCAALLCAYSSAQSSEPHTDKVAQIDVDLNVVHSVEGHSQFDRSKYVVMHSAIATPDWVGEEDKLSYLFDELDVYFGRDNGTMVYHATQITEDPKRPGYADPRSIEMLGRRYRESFYGRALRKLHKYEDHLEMMIGGQLNQLWLGNHTGRGGWSFASNDAIGEYMGLFVNEFYRDAKQPSSKGQKRPPYLEVVNEPLYELVDVHGAEPIDTFIFHNEVAKGIRRVNDTVQIGGYTTAFPWFDLDNFERWNERMKLFLDTSGEQMDFFLYSSV